MNVSGAPTLSAWHWRFALVACLALLGAKLWLIFRVNINWDEFNFLSHVFESTRGELRLLLQGAYVHLFRWLPMIDGNEVDLVLTARVVMWALLAATAWFVWRLAGAWVSKPVALVAAVTYLSTLPVLTHGASFRYDSLIAPLITASAWLVARAAGNARHLYVAAFLFGAAGALSIKTLLFAPMIAALMLVRGPGAPERALERSIARLASFALLAMLVSASFLLLHRLTIAPDTPAASGYAQLAFRSMVLDVPFLPRRAEFVAIFGMDTIVWLLLATGFICAAAQARYRSACALVLAVSPLLFYRNAWPYFYVVMLAPACVFAAIAVQSAMGFLSSQSQARIATWIVPMIIVALVARGASHTDYLREDQQTIQRAVVEVVHQVFPHPVPYVDHSGMIASFPKANFFMSTWGMEQYQRRGRSFMDEAIARSQPRFVLVNHWRMEAQGRGAQVLLPRDREVMVSLYLPYWGPIHVAGARFDLSDESSAAVELPFAGRYRVESDGPVNIAGVRRDPGAVIDVATRRLNVTRAAPDIAIRGRLVTADARETQFLESRIPLLPSAEGIYQRFLN